MQSARGRLPPDFAPAELGEVLLSQRPERTSEEQITFFKSDGTALEDLAAAQLAFG